MSRLDYQKYRIDKIIELAKFCFSLGLLCFLVIKAPNEATQVVGTAGAFILGGSKFKDKLGL
ncbi:MAG: hypothetical protein A3J07_04045 [Candidatus Doudnabacteria bacterium RIFCSPLOWO2_02_FULL_49_13]|uniref:Uncharacterized protein n=1 Tax=Candidatus Doudnabacteria bacterium RIFCSPHIGHO2_12_FULL_48_16 TaxID=1817838 RepID=A0A1F5PJP1_9BACT|nr:MAG: hypothetical protein A3B77_02850 [Candidatus Doudnabacteria bacterium RIFCSPHIGHO2_02_FULL_49_24]OGE89224.1 MAG: hypothetical protein A2760_04430 [Candidatus Doudnabacteria bacterium RIFCSPHIGHO2_01_FULL_50_67]OGE90087.1 MAG: hypothetical protein A3E29_03185 [Candidatus Doudnabacteria bacterium RIFCSPHIGHO2_12_FULL_48_16]OGF03231.1 MAG: hypothetical protein A3J07_04045 [Candidatus Doudnabacteria bacterium RIFCSPLOWO2_02_FULL_49_13]OGF03965.1 MAG: hypothetical protein A3H14_02965 [Candid